MEGAVKPPEYVMKEKATQQIRHIIVATFSAGVVTAAFLLGEHLFGFAVGLVYVLMTLGPLWLIVRSAFLTKKPSRLRAAVIIALSLPLGFAMANPTLVDSDFQGAIDQQATDRALHKELASLFASDPHFSGLAVSTLRLKIVIVTIQGKLNDRAAFSRLRNRIGQECPHIEKLKWDITLRHPEERIDFVDEDVFKKND